MADEGQVIPGESGSSSLNPMEQKARAGGWKPLDEFEGDKADWIDASGYVARGPLIEEIKSLKKHIKQQRERTDQEMSLISTQFAQMSEQAYKRAVTELESKRDVAISDQDVASVRALDKELDEARQERQKAVAVATRVQQTRQVEPSEALIEWRAQNKWFDSDQELQDEAVAIGVGYLAKNPSKNQEDMQKHVTDRIKRIYPEKFQKKGSQTVVEDEESRVEGSSTARPNLGGKKSGNTLTVSDLDDDEKNIMRTFIKRGVLKDVAAKNKRSEQAEFLAQLQERKAKG